MINAKVISAPQIAATVQGLIQLLDRLPQALGRLSAHLVREHQGGHIRMEGGTDPEPAVLAAETHLTDAEADVPDLTAHLRQASALLTRMGCPWEGEL